MQVLVVNHSSYRKKKKNTKEKEQRIKTTINDSKPKVKALLWTLTVPGSGSGHTSFPTPSLPFSHLAPLHEILSCHHRVASQESDLAAAEEALTSAFSCAFSGN